MSTYDFPSASKFGRKESIAFRICQESKSLLDLRLVLINSTLSSSCDKIFLENVARCLNVLNRPELCFSTRLD